MTPEITVWPTALIEHPTHDGPADYALCSAQRILAVEDRAYNIKRLVLRLLAKYDYPPDLEEKAVEVVLEQAELFAVGVAE